jgi:hypothetical protein
MVVYSQFAVEYNHYIQMLLSNCLAGIFKNPRNPSQATSGIMNAAIKEVHNARDALN